MEDQFRTFGARLQLVARLWRQQANEVVKPHGLSDATALVLIQLARLGEGARQTTLAAHLGIEGPSLVRQIDGLEAAGLIERRTDRADRRAKTLYLTPQGRKALQMIEAPLANLRHTLLADVSADELQMCFAVFAKIETAARRRGEQM